MKVPPVSNHSSEDASADKSRFMALTVAAVGIVYGDIGTSPLYTMRAIFGGSAGLILTPMNVLGIVSLILWGLLMIVALKYVIVMLQADNRGEGGTLALMALAHSALSKKSKWQYPLLMLGVLGACLFYGDSVITPAISILSAVEGLEVATPMFQPYLIPIALAIIVALYAVQRKGTAGIGKFFGPMMIIWFFTLATMGAINIWNYPLVLRAFNPWYAVQFILLNPLTAFIVLSAVVLALTGAETLYADMGHFGPKPIRTAWFYLVLPALTLNYLGQGGLLLANPAAISNPFFNQLGEWAIYPLVFMSTLAVVIASQATISGAFSITKQAIGLGLLPRMKVVFTSDVEMGQIYIPIVNWLQMAAVVVAVIQFRSSDNLTGAYGVAVTCAMLITTIFFFFIMHYHWRKNIWVSLGIASFFFLIDISLVSSNTLKIVHGGWFPITIGIIIFTVMMTWRQGRRVIAAHHEKHAIPLRSFLQSLFFAPPQRVAGTAIFLRGEFDGVPQALLHNLSHNKILHEKVFFLTVHMHEVPWVGDKERIRIQSLGYECFQMDLHYGFKDEVDIPKVLQRCKEYGHSFDMLSTSFFLSRQTLISTPAASGMARWREHLFVWITKNAPSAADFYHIPSHRVIELGARVEI